MSPADGDAVHRTQRSDFHGGARKEKFVGDVNISRGITCSETGMPRSAQMLSTLRRVMPGRTLAESGGGDLDRSPGKCFRRSRSYGARPLRRALQKYVEDPLSEALIQGEIQPPSVLEVVVENEGLCYRSMNDKLVAATPLSH